jgi:hypothetical protein
MVCTPNALSPVRELEWEAVLPVEAWPDQPVLQRERQPAEALPQRAGPSLKSCCDLADYHSGQLSYERHWLS